jgi:hypothetical protein
VRTTLLRETDTGYSIATNSALRRGRNSETGSSNELEDAMKIVIPGGWSLGQN